MYKFVKNFFNGLAMGVVEIIPGISGGTIAIILGFYDNLIYSINNITKNFIRSMIFIFPILLGIATGILVFSSIVSFFITYYSLPTMLFFMGLLSGIIPSMYSRTVENNNRYNLKDILLIILPVLLLIFISNLTEPKVMNPDEFIDTINLNFMIYIFVSGILASAALVIPGTSGSFVLLLLGVYPLVTYSISSIRLLLIDITNVELILNIVKVIVPLGIGMVIGILFMSKIIERLLKNYYRETYLIILGLLLGSVYALFKEPTMYQSGVSKVFIFIGVVTFFLGGISSFSLGKR